MRILFIGDIVGSQGRQIVKDRLADTVAQQQIDLVVANCENAAAGFGITPRLVEELLDTGIDVLTGGNHIFDKRELLDYFAHQPRLLRPANYPEGAPGTGLFTGTSPARPWHTDCSGGLPAGAVSSSVSSPGAARASNGPHQSPNVASNPLATRHSPLATGVPYAVLNLQGRTFMPPIDCPFRAADRELARIAASPEPARADVQGASADARRANERAAPRVILVDFHAETTSEKIAMGYHLDGRVSAVLGTHTHVPTADEQILPGGTAYLTDVGMTGPHNGIIGMDKDAILRKFLDALPARFEPATGNVQLHAALLEVDATTGKALSIARLKLQID